MKKLDSKGFGITQILLIALAAAVVSGVGFYVYTSNRTSKNNEPSYQWPNEPSGGGGVYSEKPVIYLYPTTKQDVSVRLDYNGKLVSTYPDYDYRINGWQVTANPDGTLINKSDGREYSYLFWDGVDNATYDLSTGFVVKGSDTKTFLQDTLKNIGLSPKEYNEMITYWLPRMEHSNYNLIHFAGNTYTDIAKLTITPKPDSMLRVFMVFKPLEKPVNVKPQPISIFNRQGFAVVEWGGKEIR